MITSSPSKLKRKVVMHKINSKFVWQMMCGKSGQAIHGTSGWANVSCITCLQFAREGLGDVEVDE